MSLRLKLPFNCTLIIIHTDDIYTYFYNTPFIQPSGTTFFILLFEILKTFPRFTPFQVIFFPNQTEETQYTIHNLTK